MLKIKDSVDLKELEKFGFVYNDDLGQYIVNIINEPLTINCWNRKINIIDYGILTENILVEIMYDLIKDGLVEKVEK